VRDWLLERDALPAEPLVAMIPMSVRRRDERGTWGNRISMMIVPIPTNEPLPRRRLERTHELLRSAKERHSALPASLLTDATAFIPPAVAALAARNTVDILSRTRPPLNLVISNVPGPRSSLYCAGAELLANFPLSVVVDGVGLNITVVSYKSRVDFGIVGDRDQIDDAWAFLEGARHALGELETIGARTH
jgi:WS/DGAT/MGAT family acyltransferase